MAVSLIPFDAFPAALANGIHHLGTDTIYVQFLATAPSTSGDAVETDLPADLSTGNGYTSGGMSIGSPTSSSQTAGLYDLQYNDYVFTASGGPVGPFRYLVFLNNSATNKDLIAWIDIGGNKTIASSGTYTIAPPSNILIEING